MLVYRITRNLYANDLSGMGARLYGGRWNSVGQSMLYTASSRALAVLECLVHLSATLIPDGFCIVTIKVPEDIFEPDTDIFPPNWNAFPEPDILKRTGDFFLKENQNLLMKVPSAIVQEEFNYLINPFHPKTALIKVTDVVPFTFDTRLL
ncbi:RES family NAD+ phosphorylase [Mucilaginibacter myungsuensis]|uniref:RES family NAD+ phosphorylase n=1 Tax=Mucilaginibacter myungsuensis TaxID=649104 RepID=A0A929PWH8_9SPHI|nr:RES family NAD+ phosphorylase [Mucilaginibacter myungsuensis]MBE9662149.1 RES family NAD+ phosphorylase [Mucilaginibacter myungsuensis]MDN3599417.1 RES family NAD+ phosphorylase [Mucilaginibacter myungsuensis]